MLVAFVAVYVVLMYVAVFVLVFVLGVVTMRAAGCVINDYLDRDFDPHVARTRNRPLANSQFFVGCQPSIAKSKNIDSIRCSEIHGLITTAQISS